MAVRAIRGAIQLDRDEREHLLSSTRELVAAVMAANFLTADDLISIVFTVTADLRSEFPAVAARELGLGEVPLLCTVEIDVPGALPRVEHTSSCSRERPCRAGFASPLRVVTLHVAEQTVDRDALA